MSPSRRASAPRARPAKPAVHAEGVLSILQGAVVDRAALEKQLASLRSRVGTRMTPEEIRAAVEEGRP